MWRDYNDCSKSLLNNNCIKYPAKTNKRNGNTNVVKSKKWEVQYPLNGRKGEKKNHKFRIEYD
jgi:hypothetical protein